MQNAELWKENARLKELVATHVNSLKQKNQKISELEQQLLNRKKPPTNILCQRAVRHAYNLLRKDGNEFDTHTNIHTPHNQQLFQRVVKGAMASTKFGKFSAAECIEATKIHFNSLRQEVVREENGGKAKHRKTSRNGARKYKKLQHRLQGLAHSRCPLDAENKQKARLVMKREYMSSDEDELETNEEGQQCRRVRHLPWMSDLANHYKSVCHDVYLKHVISKGNLKKYQHLIRDENCVVSDRTVPKDIPSWAVNL